MSWWPADSNATDLIDANRGTLQGDAVFSVGEGLVGGGAFKFNGAGSVFIPSPANNLGSAWLTIEAWIKPLAVQGVQTIHAKDDPLAAAGRLYDFRLVGDELQFLYSSGPSVGSFATSSADIPANVWTHVAVVFNGNFNGVMLYKNGALIAASGTLGAITVTEHTHPAYIGSFRGTSQFFRGYIDELTYYHDALNASQIHALFSAGTAGKCPPQATGCTPLPPGAVSWWPADSNATDLIDANHGTLQGDATINAGESFAGGGAFKFNGAGSVFVPSPANNLGSAWLTIEAWIKPLAVQGIQTIHAKDDPLAAAGRLYDFRLVGDELEFLYSSGLVARSFSTASADIPANVWTHVAVVFDGSFNGVLLYKNGALSAASGTLGAITVIELSNPAYIGSFRGNSQFFQGYIDELTYYHDALNASQIYALFSAGAGGKCKFQPSLAIADATVSEGAGTAAFTVSLSVASTQTITVNYSTADGTANAGADYTAIPSATLTFLPGELSKTISVSILDDALGEPSETFFVQLSGAVNATISDGIAVGTIVDNEGPPPICLAVTPSSGSSGTLLTVSGTGLGSVNQVALVPDIGTPISISSFAALSDTQLQILVLDLSPDLGAGHYLVWLSNPAGLCGFDWAIVPRIDCLGPPLQSVGSPLTILGANLRSYAPASFGTRVNWDGTLVEATVDAQGQTLVFTRPGGIGGIPVRVEIFDLATGVILQASAGIPPMLVPVVSNIEAYAAPSPALEASEASITGTLVTLPVSGPIPASNAPEEIRIRDECGTLVATLTFSAVYPAPPGQFCISSNPVGPIAFYQFTLPALSSGEFWISWRNSSGPGPIGESNAVDVTIP
ncbi:MAG: hypothetical protein HY735_09945 [Verrucomicrobia bacterium]|nr:hypothetical protein [Verrucomicrobiota bacterium]